MDCQELCYLCPTGIVHPGLSSLEAHFALASPLGPSLIMHHLAVHHIPFALWLPLHRTCHSFWMDQLLPESPLCANHCMLDKWWTKQKLMQIHLVGGAGWRPSMTFPSHFASHFTLPGPSKASHVEQWFSNCNAALESWGSLLKTDPFILPLENLVN
jgi:hypothetical protein